MFKFKKKLDLVTPLVQVPTILSKSDLERREMNKNVSDEKIKLGFDDLIMEEKEDPNSVPFIFERRKITFQESDLEDEFEDTRELVFSNDKQAVIIRMSTKEEVIVDSNEFVFGKSSLNNGMLVKQNKKISLKQAMIRKEDDKYFIRDLNSKYGTYVNDIFLEVGEEIELKSNDKIYMGDEEFIFVKKFIYKI